MRPSLCFIYNLSQILTPEVVDCLNRIAMGKESQAFKLESRLIMMARSNQLLQRVMEDDLIGLLDEKKEKQKVVFSSMKGAFDDDDADLLDL
ncbi:hypothetical protein RUND412_011446 [Rhizina undulata]